MKGRLMDLLRRIRDRLASPPVDREALREEMARTDPSFRRVRVVHHDAKQALTVSRLADGVAIRQERKFWERFGDTGQQHGDG
jgi:hypothetical protein